MKIRVITSMLIIAIFCFLGMITGAFSGKAGSEKIYTAKNLIRLHVIANSDTFEDQSLKLKVRDEILAGTEKMFKNVTNKKQAWKIMSDNIQTIKDSAEDVIRTEGKDYKVKVMLGNYDFPTKAYGDLVLKAGRYDALKVVIGEGAGHNWWCVMFPPLCFTKLGSQFVAEGAVKKASKPAVKPKAKKKISSAKFKALDKLDDIFGKKVWNNYKVNLLAFKFTQN